MNYKVFYSTILYCLSLNPSVISEIDMQKIYVDVLLSECSKLEKKFSNSKIDIAYHIQNESPKKKLDKKNQILMLNMNIDYILYDEYCWIYNAKYD